MEVKWQSRRQSVWFSASNVMIFNRRKYRILGIIIISLIRLYAVNGFSSRQPTTTNSLLAFLILSAFQASHCKYTSLSIHTTAPNRFLICVQFVSGCRVKIIHHLNACMYVQIEFTWIWNRRKHRKTKQFCFCFHDNRVLLMQKHFFLFCYMGFDCIASSIIFNSLYRLWQIDF